MANEKDIIGDIRDEEYDGESVGRGREQCLKLYNRMKMNVNDCLG